MKDYISVPTMYCSEISFAPGNIPIYKELSGINLFSSKANSISRIEQAIWFLQLPGETKSMYANMVADSIDILTSRERLGNLFVLSMVSRCFSILISSIKLKIDNSNIRQSYKYVASTALSILPALFLIYVVGYPPTDLILNACLSQAFSSALSYLSLRAGNYIRSLDLISDTKEFSKSSYIFRVLASSMMDMLLTLAWHGKEMYTDPLKKADTYSAIQYCIGTSVLHKGTADVVSIIAQSTPLISFADKFVWLAGRVAMDTVICGTHALGYVKDIRSPFINAFASVKKRVFLADSITAAITQQQNPRTKKSTFSHTGGGQITSYVAYEPTVSGKAEYRRKPVDEKKKTRGEAAPTANVEQVTEQAAETIGEINMHGMTFYKIDGQHIPKNTWGVISLKRFTEAVEAHERSLAGGHVGNARSAIKHLTGTLYEIRPRSMGDRLLGNIHQGTQGFTQVLLLGEAMDAYEHIKASGGNVEPNLMVFNTKVKHEDIGKSR